MLKQLEPVVWSKGTFLTPQHLQRQDRFLEDLMQFRFESLAFRPWGFRTLRISHRALSGGTFVIDGASGIFPDGLTFEFPGSDKAPDGKPLAKYFTGERDTAGIYLVVPQYQERGQNMVLRHADGRYRSEVEYVQDENTGASEKPVQVARKNLRLLVEGESQDGCVTLQAGRVRRSETGELALDSSFVPPLLDAQASDYLMSMVRRLLEILSARSGAIAGMRRHRDQSLADFNSADVASFWLLYTINAALPVIRHLFEVRRGHPEVLFSEILALAGALTAFSPDIHPARLPEYDHEDLGGCFAALDKTLCHLLDSVVPSNFVALTLKPLQRGIYAASLDDEGYLIRSKMYLAISAGVPPAQVIARTPHLVKVSSANQIEHLVRQALPGVPLVHVTSPPSVIPVKLNYQYFSLSQGGGAWDGITRARNIAVYIPADLPDPQVELMIVLPRRAEQQAQPD